MLGETGEILIVVRDLRCPLLVGRVADVEQLLRVIERAGNGEGEGIVLLGEAGVGKSRLAEAAVAGARSRGMTPFSARKA